MSMIVKPFKRGRRDLLGKLYDNVEKTEKVTLPLIDRALKVVTHPVIGTLTGILAVELFSADYPGVYLDSKGNWQQNFASPYLNQELNVGDFIAAADVNGIQHVIRKDPYAMNEKNFGFTKKAWLQIGMAFIGIGGGVGGALRHE